MKKLIIGALMAAAVVGCATLPTANEMSGLGTVSGYTAAYVLNEQVSMDAETREAIVKITEEAEKYIPTTNETFASTWTPIAQKYVDDLRDKDGNALPEETKNRVIKDFTYIVGLLDVYVDKKGIRQYQELVDAFIHSFCDSFLKNFKPTNGFASSKPNELDAFTVAYLNSQIKK